MMPMLEAAQKYLEMGYSVIPCEERGKRPNKQRPFEGIGCEALQI